MLTLMAIAEPRDQQKMFSTFDPARATWVVSDLKAKLDLNRKLLESREFIPGESVLRASELWRTILGRLRPDLQLISREFTVTLIAQKLASSEHEWARAPGAAQAAFDHLSQFVPVLAHPEGEEMMREWLKTNAPSGARWGRWFDLSLQLWKEFLAEGFIAPSWAAGVLANELSLHDAWSRPLYVDLGPELSAVEADLLVHLSEAIDVMVLKPAPAWAQEYKKTLVAYDVFDKHIKTNSVKMENEPLGPGGRGVEFRKYTTMIAEVKDAVARIRSWLDQSGGWLPASEIAVVAPDIELYWPALSSYLAQEGVPCQKDHVRRLHGFPDVARWLAQLRLRTGAFDESDVELALFGADGKSPPTIGYERFKTLYTSLYCREDLDRHESVAKKFAIELRAGDEAKRDDFVAWSLKQLPEESDLSRIESLFKRLFAEVPQTTRLGVTRWLGYLEQLAAKVECRILDGVPDGVACINLTSAEHSPASHVIVLGMTDANLKPPGSTNILYSDIASLADKFGFHLASEDQARLEFETRWLIEDRRRQFVLSVPETDFGGAAQAPSWLWVRGARAAEVGLDEVHLPAATRWDEIQKATLDKVNEERRWQPAQRESLERTLKEDLGQARAENFGAGAIALLSPSGIEDYLECPFVFAAKRLFALSDVAELDLEVDPSRRGSLMHKLFELLTEEPVRFELSPEEWSERVEKAKVDSGLELADERLWPPLKARYVDLGKRFLAFEREHRAKFPSTKTVGRETKIEGYLDLETGELSAKPVGEGTGFRFQGTIDRVDADGNGHFAIYDYKSSGAEARQWAAWLRNNDMQLLLYAMAVEKGLSRLEPRPVLAALYYVSRPLGRDNGFKVEGPEQQGLFDFPDKKKNRIKPEEKEKLFLEAQALSKTAAEGIRAGNFAPEPRDERKCPDCRWSALCRAPHVHQ